jgi:hypothetical protein
VRDDLQGYDPDIYTNLLRNESDIWADVVVRGSFIQQPGFDSPYRADLAFNLRMDDRDAAGCATGSAVSSRIVEIGDARFLGAGRVVDAGESLLLAPFAAGVEGWKARRWLSSEVLSDLARLGVGTVLWEVPRAKAEAAETLAREVAGEGRAKLDVVPAPAELPWLELAGPPLPPASNSLSDVVQALAGSQGGMETVSSDTLKLLSAAPQSPPIPPTLGRGRPASFLLLSPATEGRIDPEIANLTSVFIDGLEVRGGAR